MGRSKGPAPSLCKALVEHRMLSAMDRDEGMPTYPFLLNKEGADPRPKGTPRTVRETGELRSAFIVSASFYLNNNQTAEKMRVVDVTPMQAFTQLSAVFEGSHQRAVKKLAWKMLKLVVARGHLLGYSMVTKAGACVIAAQKVLMIDVLFEAGLAIAGVSNRAINCAYRELKSEVRRSRAFFYVLVRDARGDWGAFGRGKVRPGSVSREVRVPRKTASHGNSGLHHVVCTGDIPDPVPSSFGYPLERVSRYYSAPQDETTWDLANVEGAGEGSVSKAASRDEAALVSQYVSTLRERQNTVVHMGMALVNLVV